MWSLPRCARRIKGYEANEILGKHSPASTGPKTSVELSEIQRALLLNGASLTKH